MTAAPRKPGRPVKLRPCPRGCGYQAGARAMQVHVCEPKTVYCVECGAATELECICDDLNFEQGQNCTCGEHNKA